MTAIVLLGERLAYRSFNGANKALPVLASSLGNAGFTNVRQMDLERPDVTMADVARAATMADLVIVGGAMTPQWGELDDTLTKLHCHLKSIGRAPPIVVGGYAAKAAEDVLRAQPAITALFDGEGETGIVQIATAVARGEFNGAMHSIRGLCYVDSNDVYRHSTATRVRHISDADQNYQFVHVPSRHNMEIFARPDRPLKTAQIYTQRGCPWVCGFCNKSTESGTVIRLSEEALRSQLRKLREDGYSSIYLDVDTFTINIEAARREAALLHEEGFIWGSNTRIDRINCSLMREFVRLGCVYMFCGVEHVDEGVCIAVQKFNGSLKRQREQARSYREKVRSVYREMAFAGLPSSFFMILGLPKAVLDQTESRVATFRPTTFEEDVECVRFGICECDPDYINFNLLRFMPGSVAADAVGETAYTCVRPSGKSPITAGYFLPRLRTSQKYGMPDNHGVYRLCESTGPTQPTTTAVDAERVYRTVATAADLINRKRRSGGKLTRLFVDQDVQRTGLVSVDADGMYRLASLRDFESLAT